MGVANYFIRYFYRAGARLRAVDCVLAKRWQALMRIVIDFGSFRLEYSSSVSGDGNPPLWLYNNEVGDGLEVDPAAIDSLLREYYFENM